MAVSVLLGKLEATMTNDDYPVKAAAEIVIDENGEVLWVERYIFKRIHGQGETFVRESKTYTVLTSKITHGAHGGALVEHVVRAVN